MTTHSQPRTAAAIVLTIIWPGSGHAVLHRWWDVASWTILSLAVLGLGWLMMDVSSLGQLLNPVVIKRALIINGVLALARLASLIDVVWTTRAFRSWIGVSIAALGILVVAAPHLYAHQFGTETITLLETVFVEDTRQVDVLAEEIARTPEPQADPAPIEDPPDAPGVSFQDQRSDLDVGDDDRFTVLLLGTDQGYGRTGQRTDSIMVISIDPWTMQTAMFGIPRNWGGISMREEWDGPAIHPDMANTIYQYGWDHPDTFSEANDPGAAAAMVVFGDLLDIEIDHFVKVSMEGFVAVVDAMGGIEVNVTFAVNNDFSLPTEAGYTDVQLEEGIQTLTGLEAMGYARSRKSSNDYHRMGRQRCMIAAIAAQLTPSDLLLRYTQLMRAIGDHVSTDIPLSIVPSMIDIASLVDQERIATVTFVPPLFVDGGDGLGHRKPHIERVRLAVLDALSPALVGAEGVTDLGTACDV